MTPFYSEKAFSYAIIKGLESLIMSVTVTVGSYKILCLPFVVTLQQYRTIAKPTARQFR